MSPEGHTRPLMICRAAQEGGDLQIGVIEGCRSLKIRTCRRNDAADQREAIGMQAGGGKPENNIAGGGRPAGERLTTFDRADGKSG